MTLKKILVAYDGSELAEKALDMALEIVRPNEAIHLDIVNVVLVPLFSDMQAVTYESITNLMMEDGKETLYQVHDRIDDLADRTSTLLLTGTSPAAELLKMINGGEYDLVVVGHRGLSGIKEYMGSVSYKVFHESDIPVLIAK